MFTSGCLSRVVRACVCRCARVHSISSLTTQLIHSLKAVLATNASTARTSAGFRRE